MLLADGIHVATVQILCLVFGGDNVQGEYDEETNNKTKKRIGDVYVSLANQPKDEWVNCIVTN